MSVPYSSYEKTKWTGHITAPLLNHRETQAASALADMVSKYQPQIDQIIDALRAIDLQVPIGSVYLWTLPGTLPPTVIDAADQYLSVTGYPALFMVYGYTYGGVGPFFQVPDIQGRTVYGYDASQWQFKTLGEIGGSETTSLAGSQVGPHSHLVGKCKFLEGKNTTADPGTLVQTTADVSSSDIGTGDVTVSPYEGSASHENMPPFKVERWVIRVK